MNQATGTPLRFYGRRAGKPLRAARRRLVETRLPELRLPLPLPDESWPGALDPASLFDGPPRPLWLEIGFGGGEHLAAQAAARPDVGFIGCEPFINGVAKLLSLIEADGPGNVRVHDGDARPLLDALPDASVQRLFLLFPDPWPKTRHHRRRFIVPDNLDRLQRVLADGAELRFASDHMGYVRWALAHLVADARFEWLADGPADWRSRPADWIETRYEAKALVRGETCAYLRFRRRARQ